ncbi:MAG: hypothetical protein H3C35_09870 [Bacteroidetes bacterium]|nr:hypothetical protein [Bacteroidota bacterium]
MTYKIRNSIALGALVLLVIGIGSYITMFYQPRKIVQYTKEAAKISTQLQDNSIQLAAISEMQNQLRETLHRWNNRIKEIGQSDVSAETYGYLSDIIDKSGGQQLRMNMSLAGRKENGATGFNIYKLTGTSEFLNIFRFLWLLENGRKLYKVNTITVHSDEVVSDTSEYPNIKLTYDMEINGYFTTEVALGNKVMRPDSTPQPVTANPFQPSVLRATPTNVRKLLNAESISIIATAKGKALVMINDGRILTLKVGDEVFLGRVTAINPQDGSIEFTLNDGGIIRTVKRSIEFDNKEKGQ